MVDVKRLRRLALWAAGALLAGVLALAGYALVLLPFTPSVEGLLAARDDRPSVLLAADGSLLATFRRTPRDWLPLERIPPHVIDALIATEDHRFWEHPGVDWRRSLSSLAQTLGGDVSRWCLVAAIAGIGMKTQLKELVTVGVKPVLLMIGSGSTVSGLAEFTSISLL